MTDKTVPQIPWTYIPNGNIGMALKACHELARHSTLSTQELSHKLSYSEKTAVNIITDLQNLAICGKDADGRHHFLNGVSLDEIPSRLNSQFQDHILYQSLCSIAGESRNLTQKQGIEVVRELYSSANVKPSTREGYIRRILPWLEFSGLVQVAENQIQIMPPGELGRGFAKQSLHRRRLGGRKSVFLASATPDATLELLRHLKAQGAVRNSEITLGKWRNPAADLVSLGLAYRQQEHFRATTEVIESTEDEKAILLKAIADAKAIQLLNSEIEKDSGRDRTEIGLAIGQLLAREWKPSSAKRYVGGLWKYRDFLIKEEQ